MSYYKILGLEREPFSTSPDPEFFYLSNEHKAALYRLRIAVKLKRGLSVILGDVGTGKTTLSRRLFQVLKQEEDILFYMLLNPVYTSEAEFLSYLLELFRPAPASSALTTIGYLKEIEKFLFQKTVEDRKTIVLLVDEAQKLSEPCIEILRTLLNYETNEYKILQLVLMSQMELLPRIRNQKNFWDRIALKYVINPLDVADTKEMISFRLQQAGYTSRYPLFKDEAIEEIYSFSQGYPRKITMLCHDCLEQLIMKKKEFVDKDLVSGLIEKERRLNVINI
ncbi:MAG: AAA family ATPase [Candidatus Omnitrophota bacterium]